MERLDRPLVLESQPRGIQRGALEPANELARGQGAFGGRGIDDRLLGARGQQLEAVVTRVGELVDPDQPSRLDRAPARHAGHERVAPRQRPERVARFLGDGGGFGIADDRRQGPVDVTEHRGGAGVGAQRRDQLRDPRFHGRPPRSRRRGGGDDHHY